MKLQPTENWFHILFYFIFKFIFSISFDFFKVHSNVVLLIISFEKDKTSIHETSDKPRAYEPYHTTSPC